MKPAGGPSFRARPALSRSIHTSIVCAQSLTGNTATLRKVYAPTSKDAAGANASAAFLCEQVFRAPTLVGVSSRLTKTRLKSVLLTPLIKIAHLQKALA